MEKSERKTIEDNIKWFSKFSLEERFRISEEDTRSIEILRKLRINLPSVEDLISLKKLRSLPKDLMDIEYLEIIKKQVGSS